MSQKWQKYYVLTVLLVTILTLYFIKELTSTKSLLSDYQHKINWSEYYESIFQNSHVKLLQKSYPGVTCNTKNTTFIENMDIVASYKFNVSSKYLQDLSLDQSGVDRLSTPLTQPAKYPTFVTAASSNHYKESIAMINNYHRLLGVHPDLKMIYFDIGLSAQQHSEMKEYCKCEMQTFDFGKYPKHVANLKAYTWKPIIIQTVLKDHDFVLWMDASIRFIGKPLDMLFRLARQRGLQFFPGGGAVMQRTSEITFKFLNETPCMFNFPEAEATTFVISRNRFTMEYFMKPLVLCALSWNCMTYQNSNADLHCPGKRKVHDCHRFDQTMMGILTTRLFREKRRLVQFDLKPVHTVKRGTQGTINKSPPTIKKG
ncbi:uncharacterized protein LOC110446630 [Mizuhopecten yessoensis]|uniref:uncharacterized protein LOC110446630 n=1 Tax=Mizuhopecten yessoensis TaxID=6573 RepID=UPI000B45C66E|nr:uncharacterized protein LOC110446630 [Mizuhopecten yessoensis]XP_021347559.1 uncharacterized protein LOC110446630 [Mizuhopecten yessoensis]